MLHKFPKGNPIFLSILLISILSSCSVHKMTTKKAVKKMEDCAYEFKHKDLKDKFHINYWDTQSDKPVLLMLHGFGTEAKLNWSRQVEALSQTHRLILPDLLHFGSSNCENASYTVDEQVEAVHALVEDLGLEKFSVCGASYGGLVSAEFVNKYPKGVERLIIVDGPVKFLTDSIVEVIFNDFQVQEAGELMVPRTPEMMQVKMKAMFYDPPWLPMFAMKNFYKNTVAIHGSEMLKVAKALENDQLKLLQTEYDIKVPILLIWGDHDKVVPLNVGENMNKYFSGNCQLEVIPETGHMPIIEKAALCNEIMMNFLNKEKMPVKTY